MRVCKRYWCAILAMAVSLAGCETPFADQADRTAYQLIEQRQREALGSAAESRIDREMIPVPVKPEAYEKAPRTENQIPSTAGVATTQVAGPTSTGPASNAATQADNPLDALLAHTPPIDLDHQPELPQFPAPVAAGKTRLVFTLDDCFRYSLEHSRDYRSNKEDLYLAALNVALARHDFEPQFFATTTAGVSANGEASDYISAFNASQTLGVKQKLPYGGDIIATGLANVVNQIRGNVANAASAEAALQADLPLLRGAGMVAQENLIQTERTLIYEVRGFERYRRAFLVQVASAYFGLVNQRAQVLNRFQSVQSYIFITQRTAALFEAGVGRRRVTQLDLQRAQQSEFQARNDLTNALQQYELSVDTFKILLGMSAEQPLDVAPQYLNIAPPEMTQAAAVEVAQHLRLDLQTARDQVDDARRQSKVASNNLLPDVNLTAKTTVDSDPSVRSLAPEVDNYNASAGLTVNWPLDRVAERNAYRAALISISRAQRAAEQATDQVAIDVRDSLRRVRQQQYLVSLQRSNIDLAVRRKEFADIQFKNGEIDNRDYLDAETALLDAQNRFAQSISSLEIATLQFLRDTDQLRVDYRGQLLVPGSAEKATTQTIREMPAQPATQPATQP